MNISDLRHRIIWANKEKTEVKIVSEEEYQSYCEKLSSETINGEVPSVNINTT
jgi:hypothetical protein